MVRIFLILSFFLFPIHAYGHGFANYVQGQKAFAMGGAFTAVADDPSAIFYNPSGIHQLEGVQIQTGLTYFFSGKAEFRSNGTSNIPGSGNGLITKTDNKNHVIPYAYATYKVKEKFSMGLGIYSPFGQSSRWPDNWEGRFTTAGIESSIKSYRVEPVVVFSPIRGVSISFGAFLQKAELEIRQKNWLPGEFESIIDGSDSGLGWSSGILIDITDNFSLGLSYKSRIEHDFINMTVNLEPEIPLLGISDTTANMKFTTPSMLFVGLSYSFRKWNFSFDTYWTEWSVQDRLIASSNSILLGDTIIEKKWEDTLTFGLGIQYALSERCHLFAGYIYDQSPVPKDTLDAMVFHGDSQIFCTGFDFTYKSVVLGVAYGYIIAANQSFNNSVGNASNPGGGQVTGAFENSTQNVVSMNMNFMF